MLDFRDFSYGRMLRDDGEAAGWCKYFTSHDFRICNLSLIPTSARKSDSVRRSTQFNVCIYVPCPLINRIGRSTALASFGSGQGDRAYHHVRAGASQYTYDSVVAMQA
jgi:hypothetical protein